MADVLTMPAPPSGVACSQCGRTMVNREEMTAIPLADGSPTGWYCAACADCWRRQDQAGWESRGRLETADD